VKRRHHTPDQVVRKVQEGQKLLAEGKPVDEVAKYLEVTPATW
jgi:putative transposase